MSFAHAITVLFWLAAATLAVGVARRMKLWQAGRPGTISWSTLAAVPKRYFVDLHHIVARDPYIAHTHVAVAGGAVAAIALVALNYGLAIYSRGLDWAIVGAALLMLTGAAFVWKRRQEQVTRLSRGPWDRLGLTLGAFALGLLLVVLGPKLFGASLLSGLIATLALLLILVGAAELALGIGTGGPMKHAVAGLLHLAFHPRQKRFEPGPKGATTAFKPLALDAEDFGILKPKDFLWNELLSFDACVQCGKCEAACPAFAAEQPLNPKKVIQDLVAGLSSSSDAEYAGSPYPGIPLGQHQGCPSTNIVPGLIEAETVWSCTTCRACVEECPMMIEHVDAIVGMRRGLNLNWGEAPGKAAEILANLRETETQGGYARHARYNWAIDLGLDVVRPGRPVDVLLIAGEGAFDMRYQRTLRALVHLLKLAHVDVAMFGEDERDVGDVARRLGDEATFETLARRNIEALSRFSFKRIVTPDPHVLHSLRNEYPQFGASFEVLHHTALLADLVKSGKLRLKSGQIGRRVTYHDPCYLGRYNGETEAPRDLLAALGITVHEMERSGLRARCCGGGGGAPLTDIPGKRRIPDMRMNDARATGAEIVAVACPQCTAMLEGVVGERPEVLDIAELLASSAEGLA